MKIFNEPKTMEDRFQNTISRSKDLKKAGYDVIELWGCELDELKEKDPDMNSYFQSKKVLYPMDPRMALFGG